MARKNQPYFRIRNADKALELLKQWGYGLQKPWNADPFSYQVIGTDLYIRTFSTGQADIQLLWDYSRDDYNLFRRLKRQFWDDHLHFKKLFETLNEYSDSHRTTKENENGKFSDQRQHTCSDRAVSLLAHL